MKDEKYIVFKREDYDTYNKPGVYYHVDAAIDDAVVIRKQDGFAPAALFTYATTIALSARLLRDLGQTEKSEELQQIADYFSEQSNDAVNYAASRLPDL